MWLINYLIRRLTDRRVHCTECGTFPGFVVRGGHDRWRCAGCSGRGKVVAV